MRSSYGERTWPLTPARASRGAHVTSENTGLTPFRLTPSRRRDRLTSSCALSPCGKGSVTQHVHEQLPASRASLPSPSRACSKKEQAHQKPACSRNEHFKCQWPTADVCRWRGSPLGFAAARWDSIVTPSHTEGTEARTGRVTSCTAERSPGPGPGPARLKGKLTTGTWAGTQVTGPVSHAVRACQARSARRRGAGQRFKAAVTLAWVHWEGPTEQGPPKPCPCTSPVPPPR